MAKRFLLSGHNAYPSYCISKCFCSRDGCAGMRLVFTNDKGEIIISSLEEKYS